MKISELATALGIEMETAQGQYADREVSTGYASDLLSDVMANAKAEGVLVTVQAHKNAVAVASLVGLAAIVVCNSRPLPADMLDSARSEGVAVFRTPETAFEVSGRLWAALRRP
jgi:hypothetical protein